MCLPAPAETTATHRLVYSVVNKRKAAQRVVLQTVLQLSCRLGVVRIFIMNNARGIIITVYKGAATLSATMPATRKERRKRVKFQLYTECKLQ
jgi:hypothetical protein